VEAGQGEHRCDLYWNIEQDSRMLNTVKVENLQKAFHSGRRKRETTSVPAKSFQMDGRGSFGLVLLRLKMSFLNLHVSCLSANNFCFIDS